MPKKYITYIVHYYNDAEEFDYYIFHSQEEDRKKAGQQFKKLLAEQEGIPVARLVCDIESIIRYEPKNYPKIK